MRLNSILKQGYGRNILLGVLCSAFNVSHPASCLHSDLCLQTLLHRRLWKHPGPCLEECQEYVSINGSDQGLALQGNLLWSPSTPPQPGTCCGNCISGAALWLRTWLGSRALSIPFIHWFHKYTMSISCASSCGGAVGNTESKKDSPCLYWAYILTQENDSKYANTHNL